MGTERERIVFGSESQPFYELSPECHETFSFLGRKWYSLMHFFVITSIPNIIAQERLLEYRDLRKVINCASKMGFKGIDCLNEREFLSGIYEAFTQSNHRELILLSTGSAELIYNASKSYLTENNRYGKILMKLREELDKGNKK